MTGLARHQVVSVEEFAEFYGTQKDRCLRAAVASGMRPDQAEEAVAEAFARAWSRWSVVRRTESPAAWVVRTALNQNVSWWRKRRREVSLDASPDISVWDPDRQTDLLEAIRQLAPRQREAVVLRYLLDLDTASTARSMGVAPGTVSAHLHHALAVLHARLSTSERTSR